MRVGLPFLQSGLAVATEPHFRVHLEPYGSEGAGAYFEDELVVGVWVHVVAVYEPGDRNTDPPAGVHIYKDGVHRLGPPSRGTLYQTFDILPRPAGCPSGSGTRDAATAGPGAVSYFTGGLDEVAIYPRVLSANEIPDNYTVGTTGSSCTQT